MNTFAVRHEVHVFVCVNTKGEWVSRVYVGMYGNFSFTHKRGKMK